MSRLMIVVLTLGVSLLLLLGCFGSPPAPPSPNNTSNASAVNATPAPNASSPPQNQSPPAPPASDNGSAVPPAPPASDNGSAVPPQPPEPDNSSITPPAAIIIPSITGNAVIDPTNGAFTTRSCYSVRADPAVIKAGKESALHFKGYAANSEAITYTCGDEVRSNGNGGLIDFTRICRYSNAGHYTVWIALDGYVCASTPLEVEPVYAVSAQPSCIVAANSQNEDRNGTTTTYSAKVMVYNQQPRASVDWDCGSKHFNRTVGSVFNSTSPLISGALLVSCHFDTWPPPLPGSVSIGGTDCGSMVAGTG